MVVEARHVADGLWAEIDVLVEKFLNELTEGISLREAWNLIAKLKVGQNVLHVGREAVEVSFKIILQLLLSGSGLQITQEEGRRVVECLAGGHPQSAVLIDDSLAVEMLLHFTNRFHCWLQDGIEAAQHGHG